jgi:hypothetical protein
VVKIALGHYTALAPTHTAVFAHRKSQVMMGPHHLISTRGVRGVRRIRNAELFPAILLAVLLAGCGSPVTREAERVPHPYPPARLPIVLLPGISRETAQVMRGGAFGSFARLALPMDDRALAHLDDPRVPVDGEVPWDYPSALDHALRKTSVRGLQPLIQSLVEEGGYVRGNPDDPRDFLLQ